MKFLFLNLLVGIFFIQCSSPPEVPIDVKFEKRILNSQLRKSIPQLVELRNQTIDDGENQPGEIYVYILTTENFVYVHSSVMDCINSSFY